MELISVIVPVYNVEQYLERCIVSIAGQTYKNLEIILVEDGSTDSCPEICDKWAEKDSRIKVIHKENGGLSDARNAGLKIAAGELIGFVDSDDWIDENFYYVLADAMKKTGSDIAACDVVFTFDENEKTEFSKEYESSVYTPEEALETLINGKVFRAVVWNKLYKKEIVENETFPVGKYHEDEFFTYRILDKAKKLVFVENAMYFYFQRSGGIMKTVSEKHLEVLDAYLERQKLFKEKYRSLYVRDKIKFCKACVNFYMDAKKYNEKNPKQIKKRICGYRKRIRFSKEEIKECSKTEKVYVVGTKLSMPLFCAVIKTMRKIRYD